MNNTENESTAETNSLRDLSLLFLRLGVTSFGGPAVHIAMMEDEIVRRRHWLTSEEFLDMIAAVNFIPGPNSTEIAIHIGYTRAGYKGLLIAGASFIAPAVIIVSAIAWGYVKFGSLPATGAILYGIKPVVLSIVIQAIWRLGCSAITSRFLALVAASAALLALLGVSELPILFGAAFLTGIINLGPPKKSSIGQSPALFGLLSSKNVAIALPTVLAIKTSTLNLPALFFVFLKIGSVLFGSGYVLLSFLRTDLVTKLGWLSESQLLDAIAIGQVTPGPVFTTATFIGYILSGPAGALAATAGIFLPAFVFVALSAPFLPRLRRSKLAGQILNGLNAASLALMAVVSIHLAGGAIVDPVSGLIAAGAAAALFRWNINSAWLVLAGGIFGTLRLVL